MSNFLFLEITDPEVYALINGLRIIFGQKKSSSNLHITVRGPYNKKIPKKSIGTFNKRMSGDQLLIHSAGMFNNDDIFVVYMKMESDNLKNIWWKPDYPISEYGFNPHISLYVGSDKVLANAIFEFLKIENIKLLTSQFKLTEYVSKQAEMFVDEEIPTTKHFLELSNRRLVKPDILQRATNLMRQHGKLL